MILDPTERQSIASTPVLRPTGVMTRLLAIPGGIDRVNLLIADGASWAGMNLGIRSTYTADPLDEAQLSGHVGHRVFLVKHQRVSGRAPAR